MLGTRRTLLSTSQKSYTWLVDADGNWSSPANWLSSTYPKGQLTTANLGSKITANRTITMDVPVSIGTISVNDNNNYTVGGSSNLTFNSLVTAGTGFPTISAPMPLSGIVTVNATPTTTLSGVVSGNITLNKTGTGQLFLTGINTFTGSIAVNAGILTAGADSGFGAVPGTVNPSYFSLGAGSLQVNGNYTLNVNRGIILTSSSAAINAVSTATLSYSGIITGAFNITFGGTSGSTVSISGVNTYTGTTTVGAANLRISQDSCLGAVPGSVLANSITLSSSTGTFRTSASFTLNVNRGITLTANGSIGCSTAAVFTIPSVITGAFALTVAGSASGTVILSGTNTYTGATTVTNGVLSVTGSLNASSAVTCGGALLQGSGTVNGTVTVNNTAGSAIAGGTGSGNAGNLNTGALTFNGTTSALTVNTNGTTACSTVTSSGAVVLGGVTVNFTAALNAGTYTLILGASMSGTAIQGTVATGRTWSSLSIVGNNLVAVLT